MNSTDSIKALVGICDKLLETFKDPHGSVTIFDQEKLEECLHNVKSSGVLDNAGQEDAHYCWMLPETGDNGESRYVNINAVDRDFSISSLNFSSVREAYNGIVSGFWGACLEDVEGCDIVKVTTTKAWSQTDDTKPL